MGETRRVAAAQTTAVATDVAANVAQHVALANAAADEGARLVLFPELSLTGYELADAHALALTPSDSRLAPLSDVAAARDLTLVVGAPTRLGDRHFIAALIVIPDRGVDVYTKRRLGAFSARAAVDGEVPPPESKYFTAGTANPLVDIDRTRAAVAICADVGDARHPTEAKERGAAFYLASMFVIPSELEREHRTLARIAHELSMTVLLANHGAPTGGLRAAGCSAAWGPDGAQIGALGSGGPGVLVVGAGPTVASAL